MEKKFVVLFDIDGTLVEGPPNSPSAGVIAMNAASSKLIGLNLLDDRHILQKSIKTFPYYSHNDLLDDPTNFAGKTDIGIAKTLMALVHRWPSKDQLTDFLETYITAFKQEINNIPYNSLGIKDDTISQIESMGGIIGLGTGNIKEGAHLKLKSAGIDHLFDINKGGFGEDGLDRKDILAAGCSKCDPNDSLPILVVGDTPNDIKAAHQINAKCIAVPHGANTGALLRHANADVVIDSINSGLIPAICNLI